MHISYGIIYIEDNLGFGPNYQLGVVIKDGADK